MGLGTTERGATLVEYAIVAPLMFLMLFGVIESSRLAYTYSQVWTAAREGARYGTTVGDTDGNGTPNYLDCAQILDTSIAKAVGTGLTPSDVIVTVASGGSSETCNSASPSPITINVDTGATVDVDVALTYDALVPFVGSFFDGMVISSEQSRSIYQGIVGS